MRLLLDLNVLLDVLLNRAPHVEPAAELWALVEREEAEALVPAHGLTTVFYLASKERGARFAREVVGDLVSVFGVAPVDRPVVLRALAFAWPDFEDAVCAGHLLLKIRALCEKPLELNDPGRAACALAERIEVSTEFLRGTAAGLDIEAIGLGDDLILCADVDRHGVVPHVQDGSITLIEG